MERHAGIWSVISAVAKLVTALTFVGYPLLIGFLIYLSFTGEGFRKTVVCIVVPAISFVLLSVYRKIKNSPRPYEVWKVDPLIKKETKGNSFPSRHVFSIFVIGMTFMFTNTGIGAAMLLGGVYLALYRVIGGVHFVKDVVAGAFFGMAAGLVMFVLI